MGFGVASYSELFSEYSREQGLRPQGKRPWSERDARGQRGGGRQQDQQQQSARPGGAQEGKGGGKGGKGGEASWKALEKARSVGRAAGAEVKRKQKPLERFYLSADLASRNHLDFCRPWGRAATDSCKNGECQRFQRSKFFSLINPMRPSILPTKVPAFGLDRCLSRAV